MTGGFLIFPEMSNFVSPPAEPGVYPVIIILHSQFGTQMRRIRFGQTPPSLRLIRVDLPTGETEVLITSLTDRQKYPIEIFGDLYHQRWPVEEDYKVMKSRIQIENFSGKTVHSVYQDFYAKIFTKNFASILIQVLRVRSNQSRPGVYMPIRPTLPMFWQ